MMNMTNKEESDVQRHCSVFSHLFQECMVYKSVDHTATWRRDDTELPGESGGALGSLLLPLMLDIMGGCLSRESKNTRSCRDVKPSDDIICKFHISIINAEVSGINS